MKKRMIFLLALPLAPVVILITLYDIGPGISIVENPSSWGSFGSFFGGVLGPLLAYFSLIGVGFTLSEQSRSNKISDKSRKDSLELSLQVENMKSARLKDTQMYDDQNQAFNLALKEFDFINEAGNSAFQSISQNHILGAENDRFLWQLDSFSSVFSSITILIYCKKKLEVLMGYKEKVIAQMKLYKHNLEVKSIQKTLHYNNCVETIAELNRLIKKFEGL
ncbi:hypothetical protein B5G52_02020 [Pseudoalteromonas sp. A601]|uniref:hypothetical protein n=1 Tax=Pseudoalteromonas sp. A601 TaxID=1967839 RepID=UPI000B3C584B|nr:hypothetical protein [Pseudoalteromonas sp. A601]OUS74146.1 hypothetical protein B5G52_02020 [Pseudoalteromonas sp. A601]